MKFSKLIVIIVLGFSIISCGGSEQTVVGLSANQFKEMMDKSPEKIVLDVRTNDEVAMGIINSAVQIDYNSPSFESEIEKLDKSKPVFVYCAVGGRSIGAGQILQEKGFKQIYNLEGGINAWQASGFAIQTPK